MYGFCIRFPLFGNCFTRMLQPVILAHSRLRNLFIRNVENVQTSAQGERSLPRQEYRGKYEEQTKIVLGEDRKGERSKRIFIDRIERCFQSNLRVCFRRVRDFVARQRYSCVQFPRCVPSCCPNRTCFSRSCLSFIQFYLLRFSTLFPPNGRLN